MADLTPFHAGIAAAKARQPSYCADPRAAFMDVLSAAGFRLPKTIQLGRIDRIDGPEDKPGKKSAWYSYTEIPDTQADGGVIGIGSYGCWKTGLSESWCSRSTHQMTTSEALALHASRESLRAQRDAEERARYAEAAERAAQIMQEADDCTRHEYLARKGVQHTSGLKIGKDGALLIPVFNNSGIISIQRIWPDGTKRFLTGGKTKGGFFAFPGDVETIYIAEGYATAKSLNMASDAMAYCAFSAANLLDTAAHVRAEHPAARIIIAGDNGNGSRQAEQAAESIRADCIFPPGHKDFNDFHAAAGLEAVSDYLKPKAQAYIVPSPANQDDHAIIPPGILGDIVGYYNATSGNAQPGFAIQTALALCSVILGRSYKTDYDNFPSLYLLNVGKSSTGKEHAKTVVEKILYAANLGHMIAGDGYTSAGAVFSALLDRPRHISVIDEFGRYLEAGRDMKGGNHHQREANTKLMESIGRAHSVIRPPTYSTMTLKKSDADLVKNRQVYNPAITLLTMTTPDTLFKTLDMGAIKDGFVNRFIISISDAERAVRKHKPSIDVPQRILDWINAVNDRHGRVHVASEPAQAIVLSFTDEAISAQNKFQEYCIDKANYLERFGMAELPGRSNEMAMRIALITALAKNPNAEKINQDDMIFAIEYIKAALEKTIDRLKITISASSFEADKKEILADLRSRGEGGITWSAMQKNAPYSKHKAKDLKEILVALKDADLAVDEPIVTGGRGRPTVKWMALK